MVLKQVLNQLSLYQGILDRVSVVLLYDLAKKGAMVPLLSETDEKN